MSPEAYKVHRRKKNRKPMLRALAAAAKKRKRDSNPEWHAEYMEKVKYKERWKTASFNLQTKCGCSHCAYIQLEAQSYVDAGIERRRALAEEAATQESEGYPLN